jgi:hypothetical protein
MRRDFSIVLLTVSTGTSVGGRTGVGLGEVEGDGFCCPFFGTVPVLVVGDMFPSVICNVVKLKWSDLGL